MTDIWSVGGFAVAFVLICLLIAKLLANSHGGRRARLISESLNIPIWIFMATFVIAVLFRITILLD